MSLSEYIKQYLQAHEISLNELSRQCGISKGYMSMIVQGVSPSSGKPIVPSIKILQRLANGTGITLNDLCASVDSYVDLHQDSAPVSTALEAVIPSKEESAVLIAYRNADETRKDVVCDVLHITRPSAAKEKTGLPKSSSSRNVG